MLVSGSVNATHLGVGSTNGGFSFWRRCDFPQVIELRFWGGNQPMPKCMVAISEGFPLKNHANEVWVPVSCFMTA